MPSQLLTTKTAVSNYAVPGRARWNNPGSIEKSDDKYAYAALGSRTQETEWHCSYAYGAEIPLTATIIGIEVRIEKSAPERNVFLYDKQVFLTTAYPFQLGENKAILGERWPERDSWYRYGDLADLWEYAWTPLLVNRTGFGACVQASHNTENRITARMDAITIEIFYELPSTKIDHLPLLGVS